MDKQSPIVKGKTVKQVRKLNLSGQNLTEIPSYVFEHTNLKKLVLSRNALSRIPKEIAKLKKLEVLDLTYNKLDTLPAPVFKLPKLRVLAVGHNNLRKFPVQLKGSSIRELIADHNQIEKIEPDALDGIEKLIISSNPVSGKIVTHSVPKLLSYDFRNTGLIAPSAEFLNPECKGWPSKQAESVKIEDAPKEAMKEVPQTTDNGKGFIFISHSSKDKKIVKKFSDEILRLGMDIPLELIRCTSIEGAGISNGTKMREWIENQIESCSAAFLLISPAYQTSQICLNEMGAIWALKKNVKILLLPGVEYNTMGWLEEIRQAGHIVDENALDQIADDLKTPLSLKINLNNWSRKKKEFLEFCESYKPDYIIGEKGSENSAKTDKIYIDYCNKIFELLQYKKFSAWAESAIGSRPRIPISLLADFEELVPYLDSRAKYEGYDTFNKLFVALSLLIDDYLEVFNIFSESRNNSCQIRAFYYDYEDASKQLELLDDYNAYVDFLRNMIYEFTRICNAILSEARLMSVDYMPDFGIFAIDGIGHQRDKVVTFQYKDDEIYKGIMDFIDSSITREYYARFDKQKLEKVLAAVLTK